jgi:hypothetical protein
VVVVLRSVSTVRIEDGFEHVPCCVCVWGGGRRGEGACRGEAFLKHQHVYIMTYLLACDLGDKIRKG